MIIKEGVKFHNLSEEICDAAEKIAKIYLKHGRTLVITSGRDGVHKKNSKHYTGNAIDTRIFYFTKEVTQLVAEEIKNELGANYDVLIEWNKNHIHIEYDPK